MVRKTTFAIILCCALAPACHSAKPRRAGLHATFDSQRAGLEAWDLDGRWKVQRGALACDAPGMAVATWCKTPMARTLRAQATLTVTNRTGAGAWTAAGLCVWQDGGNYWRLALV